MKKPIIFFFGYWLFLSLSLFFSLNTAHFCILWPPPPPQMFHLATQTTSPNTYYYTEKLIARISCCCSFCWFFNFNAWVTYALRCTFTRSRGVAVDQFSQYSTLPQPVKPGYRMRVIKTSITMKLAFVFVIASCWAAQIYCASVPQVETASASAEQACTSQFTWNYLMHRKLIHSNTMLFSIFFFSWNESDVKAMERQLQIAWSQRK